MAGKEMTSYERVMTGLEGGRPDRVPVIPIVREWCARQAEFRFSDIMASIEKYVYSQYYCIRTFGYDAVWDLLAIHAESEAMGSVLKIQEDTPPSVEEHFVQNYDSDLRKLKIPDPHRDGRLPFILEGISRLKELCQNEYAVIGYIQAPFRHACMLRGSEAVMRDCYKNRNNLAALLEITTESQIVYGKAVAGAGADVICLSDPSSSGDAVSTATWEEFGAPYTRRVVEGVKKTGIKIFLHICGDTSDRLESLAKTGVDALSLDHKVDFRKARETLGDTICLMGNINPSHTLLFGKPQDVIQEAEYCIHNAGRKGNFILSSGCMMPADVPPENVRAMVEAARKTDSYT